MIGKLRDKVRKKDGVSREDDDISSSPPGSPSLSGSTSSAFTSSTSSTSSSSSSTGGGRKARPKSAAFADGTAVARKPSLHIGSPLPSLVPKTRPRKFDAEGFAKIIAGIRERSQNASSSLSSSSKSNGIEGSSNTKSDNPKNGHSTVLDLSRKYLDATAGEELASALWEDKVIKELILRDNQLGDVGVLSLAIMLSKNTTLTSLDVRLNGLTAYGAKQLVHCLRRSNIVLTSLLIDERGDDALEPFLGAATEDVSLRGVKKELAAILKSNENVHKAAAGSLRKLELNSRQLRVIPVMLLRDCQSIEELDYSQNSINIVPPAIGEFMHLKLLNLSSNKLAELPPSLCHCFSLHTLLLAKNHFSIFPACLAEMKSLVHVDMSDNRMDNFPQRELGKMPSLKSLILTGNPLSECKFPAGVVDAQGTRLVTYLKESKPDTEVKTVSLVNLIVLGNEGVGKTSLIANLIENKKASNAAKRRSITSQDTITKEKTAFLNINNWQTKTNEIERLDIRVWDFMDYEIYYAGHKCCLTPRSIYVIVFDPTKTSKTAQLEYWLLSIQKSAAQDAPILLVGTRGDSKLFTEDLQTALVDKTYPKFKARFSSIRGMYIVSNLKGKGLLKVRQKIIDVAASLPYIPSTIAVSHTLLRDKLVLQSNLKPFVTFQELTATARSVSIVTDASLAAAIEWLTEYGYLIHDENRNNSSNKKSKFKKDSILVASPKWMLQAIGAILTSKHSFITNGEELDVAHLPEIWKPPAYPRVVHQALVNLFESHGVWTRSTHAGKEVLRLWWIRDVGEGSVIARPGGKPNSIEAVLKTLELDKYLPVFQKQEITFESFLLLTEEDLKDLGLPTGPRKSLLNAIRLHAPSQQQPARFSLQFPRAADESEEARELFNTTDCSPRDLQQARERTRSEDLVKSAGAEGRFAKKLSDDDMKASSQLPSYFLRIRPRKVPTGAADQSGTPNSTNRLSTSMPANSHYAIPTGSKQALLSSTPSASEYGRTPTVDSASASSNTQSACSSLSFYTSSAPSPVAELLESRRNSGRLSPIQPAYVTTVRTTADNNNNATTSNPASISHYTTSAPPPSAYGNPSLPPTSPTQMVAERKLAQRHRADTTRSFARERWEIDPDELDLQRQIGRGAFGTVWLSKWRNSDVVVKKIFTETMLTAEQLTEFRAEAELMMRLRPHKNVVQLLGVSMQPDDLCLVIEYLPLGDVLTLLRKEKLSVTAKLRLALGTAAAMAHLHKERVLHRDLATRNLLVTQANGVYDCKVTDFGLSRKSSGTYESSTGFGPLKWMSPEAIHPKTKAFSTASDVWSMGVVIWEMFTNGQEPFGDMDTVAAGMAILMGERLKPPPPPGCPEEVADLMRECWRDDPVDRPSFDTIYKRIETLLRKFSS